MMCGLVRRHLSAAYASLVRTYATTRQSLPARRRDARARRPVPIHDGAGVRAPWPRDLQGLPNVAMRLWRAPSASANLLDAQDRPTGTYSRGMRQRIRMAAAVVHDPEVLLLDEPLNGTDPRQRVEFAEYIGTARRAEGKTVLISSHILEEVEVLADRILLVVSGKLAAAGNYHAIREQLDHRPFHVRIVASRLREMASALVGLDAVDTVSLRRQGHRGAHAETWPTCSARPRGSLEDLGRPPLPQSSRWTTLWRVCSPTWCSSDPSPVHSVHAAGNLYTPRLLLLALVALIPFLIVAPVLLTGNNDDGTVHRPVQQPCGTRSLCQ